MIRCTYCPPFCRERLPVKAAGPIRDRGRAIPLGAGAVLVLGMLLTAALSLTGWLALGEGKLLAQDREPRVPAAGQPPGIDPLKAERTSRLVLFAPPAPGGQALLYFDREQVDPKDPGGDFQGLLAREILRQAVLIAARDGLGLGTRDATLREPAPEGQPRLSMKVGESMFAGWNAHLSLHDRRGKLLSYEQVLIKRTRGLDYLALLEGAEQLSRQRLPEALRKAGVEGKAQASRATGAVPRQAEQALPRMTFLAQVTALRALHGAMRDQGESPELLGALVRAYANLGVLTEFHWNASHKAYHARALLYAQRLVARDPQSPWGLYHRAYALALAGLHGAALADLGRARKQQEKLRVTNFGDTKYIQKLLNLTAKKTSKTMIGNTGIVG